MEEAYNKDLQTQIQMLEEVLLKSDPIKEILRLATKLNMLNWYLGAGCLSQTYWNLRHGFGLSHEIKDYDLVYFDSSDISSEGQESYIAKAKELFKDITIPVEIVNEARVHLWYEQEFGRKIEPYNSVEEAINQWPTNTTGVGVKYNEQGQFRVYAPYGLNDFFGLIVRPVKIKITPEIYQNKVNRWSKVWPKLKIIHWNE